MPSIRRLLLVGLTGLSLGGSGCALFTDGICVTSYWTKETISEFRERVRDRDWAKEAWAEVRRTNPNACYSDDYAAGFEDGFASYVYRGGNCEPPPLPPKHYRKVSYQTPQGYRAIEDWFEGYRQGAGFAKDRGYRQWVTGPTAIAHPVVTVEPRALQFPEPAVAPPTPPPEPIAAPKDVPVVDPKPHARIINAMTKPEPAPEGPPPHARILGAQTKPEPPAPRPDA